MNPAQMNPHHAAGIHLLTGSERGLPCVHPLALCPPRPKTEIHGAVMATFHGQFFLYQFYIFWNPAILKIIHLVGFPKAVYFLYHSRVYQNS